MMVILYVDDCGIAAKDPKDIEQLIDDLRALDFELTREGDFTEFLGISRSRRSVLEADRRRGVWPSHR